VTAFKHGRNGYQKFDCRCKICVEAERKYKNEYNARRRAVWEEIDDERRTSVPEHVETRVCAQKSCTTLLSRYNTSDRCHLHQGPDILSMRLPIGSRAADELRKLVVDE
jgi:hypothetical protein